jgi:hypothetical protein
MIMYEFYIGMISSQHRNQFNGTGIYATVYNSLKSLDTRRDEDDQIVEDEKKRK